MNRCDCVNNKKGVDHGRMFKTDSEVVERGCLVAQVKRACSQVESTGGEGWGSSAE